MLGEQLTGGPAHAFCGHTSDEFEAAFGNCRKKGFFGGKNERNND
jgi:hypothetical protein